MTILHVFAAICLCQTKIPLVDISGAGSPVRISGAVSFQDDPTTAVRYTYIPDGSITNVSSKGILLTVSHIVAGGFGAPGFDDTVAVDRFFGPDALNPGRVERIPVTPMQFGQGANVKIPPAEVGLTANPSATAQLIFVQFVDGSTWGDLDVRDKQLARRENVLLELKRLEDALKEKGDLGLKDELSQLEKSWFLEVDLLKRDCADKETSCLVNGLRGMLSNAERHQMEMRPASSQPNPK